MRRHKWAAVRSSPWFHLFVAMLLMVLIHGFIVKPYVVPSPSMEQTLEVGDRIYVNRILNNVEDPERGDIVVFNASESWESASEISGFRRFVGAVGDVLGIGPSNHHALVKRVIGVPGDIISCCSSQGAVIVNRTALSESHISNDYPFIPGQLDCNSEVMSSRCFAPIKVPSGEYLVMGDQRSNSSDSVSRCRAAPQNENTSSTCARFAQRTDIVGKVLFRFWPFSRIGGI